MPCCTHCIEYFEPEGDCPCCGHPRRCPPHCWSFPDVPALAPEMEGAMEAEEFQAEQQYRAEAAARARKLGLRVREISQRLGGDRPEVVTARLDLLEAFTDPEWVDFDAWTPGQRASMEACADRLLQVEHGGFASWGSRFGLRLARIYIEARSIGKGGQLARTALGELLGITDDIARDLTRLGWTCYQSRVCLDISEECYRRAVGYLRETGREYLDPLDCLERVLTASGRVAEGHTIAEEVRVLRAGWEATRREKFVSRLNSLRARWERQNGRSITIA